MVKSEYLEEKAGEGRTRVKNPLFDQKVTLNDSCAYSAERIKIVVRRGKVLEVDPETTRYLAGGG